MTASTPGRLFQSIIAGALLIAASGPAYYFGVHRPARENRLDAERAQEQQTRALLQERDRLLLAGRYQRCLQAAQDSYQREWARGCAWQAEQARRAYPACVARGVAKAECAAAAQPAADCALVGAAASQATDHYERQRDRCLEELKAGIRE